MRLNCPGDDGGPVSQGLLDHSHDPVRHALADDRAVACRGIKGVAYLDGVDECPDLGHDLVMDRLVHQHPRRQSAALAREAAEGHSDVEGTRGIQVSVFENDVGRLAAQFQDHRLGGFGAGREDLGGRREAAGEADLLDQRVGDQPVPGVGGAGSRLTTPGGTLPPRRGP
jgi:hypothetical protein